MKDSNISRMNELARKSWIEYLGHNTKKDETKILLKVRLVEIK